MARRKIKWSYDSKLELRAILAFYKERNGNSVYSKKLNKRIKRTISYLIKHPELGRETDLSGIRVIRRGI